MREKDITQKDFFTNEERFADFINAVCYHGQKILKPEELINVPESVRKADKDAVLERTCDIVKKQAKDGAVYAIYVMENQEKVDYRMPVRVMLEEGLIYDAQTKKIARQNAEMTQGMSEDEYLCGFRKTDHITPVYTIVVYWGDKEWDGAKSLREMVEIPVEDETLRKEMLELIPDYKIKVFDLNKETDFKAFGKTLKTVFEFFAAGKDKKLLRDYMYSHEKEVEALDQESKFFLATMLGQKRLRKKLLKRSNQKEEGIMCKAIDDMIEDGRAEGRAESEHIIQQLRKELEEERERSNCKAIDDMIEDGRAEGRAESERIIQQLRKELEEERERSNGKALDDLLEEGRMEGRAEAERTILLLKQEISSLKEKLAAYA